jgi:beta-mannosidase
LARRVLDLSILPWQMGRVPRQAFGMSPADDRRQVTEWLPAKVPGDVRADLIAAGRIPPIETPDGITAGAWADDYDWWYRAELPEDMAGDALPDATMVLEAEGIDYYSAIWLDNTLLATHAGMFARQAVTLPTYATRAGRHELAVRIWGGGALPRNTRSRRWLGGALTRLHPGVPYFSERMAVPKAQFSFGWDFAPRLLSAGIWDDLRLVFTRGAYIEDLWAYGKPLSENADPSPVRWHIRLRIARYDCGPVQVQVNIAAENFPGAGYETLYRTLELCPDEPAPCISEHEFDLNMAQARLWWPWDQGEPCLYRVTVVLRDDRGVLDEISQIAGARAVRRERFSGGAPWRFVLNNRPIFLRGANWVPADLLPGRVTSADYTRLIGQAHAAGINFLRVWGGGVREKAAFWETCDRLGMLAWQEFPLACDFFDRYPDHGTYLTLLGAEAQGIIRALRGHPSLIAWCGGNEIDTRREAAALHTLAEIQASQDPTRPWIPASPSDGDVHQWTIWHSRAPWTELAQSQAPFMSEFGLQAPPVAETLAEMFPEGLPTRWTDARWTARKAQTGKLLHYAPAAGLDVEQAVALMQRVQSAALQLGLEACRLQRDTCGGVAFWQLNEPWPAVTWSVIDRAGRPKAAYAMLQGSFRPLLVAARFPRRRYAAGDTFHAQIWIAHDGMQSWPDCRLEAELDGETVYSHESLAVGPACVFRVGDFEVTLAATPQRLGLRLLPPVGSQPQQPLAANCYDLSIPLPGRRPLASRLSRWLAGQLIKTG